MQNTTPRFNISNKSEAPEDGLLDLPANVLMGGVVSQQQAATQKKRYTCYLTLFVVTWQR